MNQVVSAIMGLIVIIGGFFGLSQDPYEKEISESVTEVNDAVMRVKSEYGVLDAPHFRALVDSSQSFVTRKWWDAQDNIGMSPEHLEINENYRKFLAQAGTILDSYNRGVEPESGEWEKYEKLRDELK